MNQDAEFSAEFYVNLAGPLFDDEAETELRMGNPVADAEARLHRIVFRRAGVFEGGRAFFSGRPGAGSGRRAPRSAKQMIALAGAALHALNAPGGLERDDDVFAFAFAFAAQGVEIISRLQLFDDSNSTDHLNIL